MKHNRNRQKGSAHVVLVACLVIALLFALGWIFYQNFVYKDSAKKDTELIVIDKEGEEVGQEKLLSANWLQYSSPEEAYKVRLPDGWKVQDADGLLHVWSDMRSGRLDYVEGKKAVVEDIEGGRDGVPSFWLQSNSGFSYSNPLQDSNVVQGFKTYQGLTVNKYYKLWGKPGSNELMPAPKGTKDYVYEIEKSGKKVLVRYAFFPGEFDEEQLKIVEELVRTVEL